MTPCWDWPSLNLRESWDLISVIDPLFTVPLLLFSGLALFWQRRGFTLAGLVLGGAYLCFGGVQRERAEAYAEALARSRGHVVERLTVRPSFGNVMVWRLLYQKGDHYYVDAVSLAPLREPVLYAGRSVPVFSEADARELAAPDSVLGRDIERFRFFSQGYLALAPEDPEVVGDLRYATLPNQVQPLSGIRIDPERPDAHVRMEYFREASKAAFRGLWAMICGRAPGAVPRAH